MTPPRILSHALLVAMAALAATGACSSAEAAPPRKPNVLVIMSDDLGYGDLSFAGSEEIRTPNIDRLAREGSVFKNAYVTAPVCLPSRMGMLTGSYQERFGVQTLAGPGGPNDYGIPLDRPTLGEQLRPAGYATGIIGKWHVGDLPRFLPNARGFDEFFGFLGGSLPYFPDKPGVVWRNDRKVEKTEYMTDAFGGEAVDFINRRSEAPFCLFLAFSAVHLPLEATEKYLEPYAGIKDRSRRNYAAMTSAMDANIGLVLDALEENRVLDDTLIFFLSDNGGFPRFWSSNAPFRGGKYEMFEGGIRTPFIVRWKNGGVPGGRTFDELASSMDIVPTALAAAGSQSVSPHELDGVDLLPVLLGEAKRAPRERLFWRYGPTMCAVREGDYKLLKNGVGENREPVWELYNVEEDPGERRDLATAEPERLAAMAAVFSSWDDTLPPPAFIDRRLRQGIAWWQVKPGQSETVREQD